MTTHDVDARRMLCPMPVIKLQNAVNKAAPGDGVNIVCTDPGSVNDIGAWCRINGHRLDHSETKDHEFYFRILVEEDT